MSEFAIQVLILAASTGATFLWGYYKGKAAVKTDVLEAQVAQLQAQIKQNEIIHSRDAAQANVDRGYINALEEKLREVAARSSNTLGSDDVAGLSDIFGAARDNAANSAR